MNKRLTRPETAIELWGGLECSVVRVQDGFRNQLDETGHTNRIQDLDAIAALGIRTLRYPLLWEAVAPVHRDMHSWQWHDARLHRLRELGIAPIAGLLHHGSGPQYTSLVDPVMPQMLAQHAHRVATRYPWIDMYTPVNEPLTTARFSGLYGHWYPHGRDIPTFLRTLVNQCRAVVLCMQAIRRINSSAKLVQTEDLGKTFSTHLLSYQADYENERRWLSFDLLCGRLDRSHPWYQAFIDNGISAQELGFFLDSPCVPDVMGINHYLTSERFLDQRMQNYPAWHNSGNGRHHYADVEAVRMDLPAGLTGPKARLEEAWRRYGLPLAVTEAHHGGAREEQLRWLVQVWNAALDLRNEGVDLRAVTVWSLLGCVDWNTLLMQRNGFYESGAFDVRSDPPRPTALAAAVKSLAAGENFNHSVLDNHGWWQRSERYYQPSSRPPLSRACTPRRILIAGAGTLGRAFARICQARGLDHVLMTRSDMNITQTASVEAALDLHRPWAVINAAGYVRVAEAEREAERCFRENALGAEILAAACARLGIPYVTFSSDLVFNGQQERAYVESDSVSPASVYGASKAEAERLVAQVFPQALVIRTSAFFGPWDEYNFVYTTLRNLNAGSQVCASDNVFVSPTYVPDLVNNTLDLLIDGSSGIWHLASQGTLSWYELALRTAREAKVTTDSLICASHNSAGTTALSSERGLIMPPLEHAIQRFVREKEFSW